MFSTHGSEHCAFKKQVVTVDAVHGKLRGELDGVWQVGIQRAEGQFSMGQFFFFNPWESFSVPQHLAQDLLGSKST